MSSRQIFTFTATTEDGVEWDERKMLTNGVPVTPWQQLKAYCERNKVGIKSITAHSSPNRHITNKGKAGYAAVYSMAVSFTGDKRSSMSRGICFMDDSDSEEMVAIWVSEDGGMRSERVPTSGMRPHIILGAGEYSRLPVQ